MTDETRKKLMNAVEKYNSKMETASEFIDPEEMCNKMNGLTDDEVQQAIKELKKNKQNDEL